MGQKTEAGHDNVKKIVDIHKTNEELSQQLLNKVEQNKKIEERVAELELSEKEAKKVKKDNEALEAELQNQKVAYEVLLDQLAQFQDTDASVADQVKELEAQIKDLVGKNQKVESEKQELEDRLEQAGKGASISRNSIGSDGDEYSSVQEMKDHLNHARQILIGFIQKLPYS